MQSERLDDSGLAFRDIIKTKVIAITEVPFMYYPVFRRRRLLFIVAQRLLAHFSFRSYTFKQLLLTRLWSENVSRSSACIFHPLGLLLMQSIFITQPHVALIQKHGNWLFFLLLKSKSCDVREI